MSIRRTHRWLTCFFLLALYLLPLKQAKAYGVLTHQAVVDAAWDKDLVPLLLHRFPEATEEQLQQAHAYAYGGSIIQDMGYFPFGNTFFTDLTHYVRSGDFVENLIGASLTLDEYAFALGALAHYNADIHGHPIGTNEAVAMVYPKVKEEFGSPVTYADDPVSHVKMEFGFDVLQVAQGNYAPEAYKKFIGFEVAPEVLEKAFVKTYGLELKDVFTSLPMAVGSYRYTIKNILPELTKAAWKAKQKDINAARPGATQREFQFRMSRASYHQQWGNCYEKPHIFARATAYIMKVLPKLGPLKPLAFVPPTPEAEEVFMQSFNTTVREYTHMLQQLRSGKARSLPNLQLDTGKPTVPGAYAPADEAYAKLLEELGKTDFKRVAPDLQKNILHFFGSAKATEMEADEQEEHAAALARLKALHQ
ncbi:zinc dependent phospholipase C family protein [Pontibacter akesuensis]|nr:zinc dependent phospholipase C family protein [Pontibacter akesuensis]